jgi:hypothetical protein
MDFQEDSRMSKTLSQLGVEEVKTLSLDGYREMLNTGSLGGEGVSCKCYVSRKLPYHVDYHGMSGCHVSPHYSHNGASHVWTFKKILECPKPYHNWGLKKSKLYP